MLEIQIVSDLHIEFYKELTARATFFKPRGSILALVGDIGCAGNVGDFEHLKAYLTGLMPHYKLILFLGGNHLYYFNPKDKPIIPIQTMDMIDKKVNDFCRSTQGKIIYMNNKTLELKSGNTTYVIIGSTLWSYIPDAEYERIKHDMNDYPNIYVADKKTGETRSLHPADVSAAFKRNYQYIKTQIAKHSLPVKANQMKKIIILTHHCPYVEPTYNPKNYDCAYYSDCSALFKKPVILWAFGHLHKRVDFKRSGVRFYSNCKGYIGQKTNFARDESIKV